MENTLTGWSSDYYKIPNDAEELQDLIEFKNMNFAIANIFKAAYRLGSKDGTTEQYDLEKIIWFAERELARQKNILSDHDIDVAVAEAVSGRVNRAIADPYPPQSPF